jgi:RNA polymerase sigma-70 factor, ECF subfamily
MQCVGTLRWSDVGVGVWNPSERRGADTAKAPAHAVLKGSDRRACPGETAAAGARVNGETRRSESGRDLTPQTRGEGARRMDGEARPLEIDWSQTVRRCMDGDSAAWAELVRAHHKRVYGLCYRFTGSPTDSEDLTQDVFLKIYSNLSSFDTTRGSLQVWITTMTRNLLVDNFRRTKNQRATSSLDEGWDQTEELRPVDRLVGRDPSPHEMAARKELGKMVQEALSHVSVELREAVILRDLQDMDYKEIAQVLQIPEGTVKSRISRGRAELARLLERTKREVM